MWGTRNESWHRGITFLSHIIALIASISSHLKNRVFVSFGWQRSRKKADHRTTGLQLAIPHAKTPESSHRTSTPCPLTTPSNPCLILQRNRIQKGGKSRILKPKIMTFDQYTIHPQKKIHRKSLCEEHISMGTYLKTKRIQKNKECSSFRTRNNLTV